MAGSVARSQSQICRQLVGFLTASLRDLLGEEAAESLMAQAGQTVAEGLDACYRKEFRVNKLSRAQVASVFVDPKTTIGWPFHVLYESDDRIELSTEACVSEELTEGYSALCMITSNVFGVIAAENLGYARVTVDQSTTSGNGGCRISIHLEPDESAAGREYFATS